MSDEESEGGTPIPEGWPPRRSGSGGGTPRFPKGMPRAFIPGILIGLVLIIGLGLFISGQGGIVEINDTQVAVKVNYLTGSRTLVDQPGYKIFIPWFNQVFLFDKSPNEFIMEGKKDLSYDHVRELKVRANDGSTFWFETLKIQYQLLPSRASEVLDDSGYRDAFKRNWVRASARSILRDEFGKFSAEEVADTTNYGQATIAAKERLTEVLTPHGIRIIEVIIPKPKFDPTYEQLIEDRKVANQEVERLKIQEEQLVQERERKVAEVEREKATEYEALLGELEAERIRAERDRIEKEKSADAFAITEMNRGLAEEKAMTQRARALEEQARKEAEGLRARVAALEERGTILVRERLAELFASITFELIPYRKDPSPIRIEHLGGVTPGDTTSAGGRRQP